MNTAKAESGIDQEPLPAVANQPQEPKPSRDATVSQGIATLRRLAELADSIAPDTSGDDGQQFTHGYYSLADRRAAAEAISLVEHGQLGALADRFEAMIAADPVNVANTVSGANTAASDASLLEKCRGALRSIGPVYRHVESAARRAAKGGNEKASEALEHVYGRLYWMDYALGTMQERVAADLRATPPDSPLFNPLTVDAP